MTFTNRFSLSLTSSLYLDRAVGWGGRGLPRQLQRQRGPLRRVGDDRHWTGHHLRGVGRQGVPDAGAEVDRSQFSGLRGVLRAAAGPLLYRPLLLQGLYAVLQEER